MTREFLLLKSSKTRSCWESFVVSFDGENAILTLWPSHFAFLIEGKVLTANTGSKALLEQKCKKEEIEVWLPNGDSYQAGNGCFTSPFKHFRSGPNLKRGEDAILKAVQPSSSKIGPLSSGQSLRILKTIVRPSSHQPGRLACARI